jgi:hypothetical protein
LMIWWRVYRHIIDCSSIFFLCMVTIHKELCSLMMYCNNPVLVTHLLECKENIQVNYGYYSQFLKYIYVDKLTT